MDWTFRKVNCSLGAEPSPSVGFFLHYSFDEDCVGERKKSCRQETEFVLPDQMLFREWLPGMTHFRNDRSRDWSGVQLPPALKKD